MVNKQGNNASKSNSKAKFSMSVSANSSSSKNSNSSNSQPASKSQIGVNKRKQQEEEDDQEDEQDQESVDSMDQDDDDEEEEPDTDQEIENSKKVGASKKTAKRKRRATSPTSFGATLQGLLGIGSSDQVSTLPEDVEEEDEDQEENQEEDSKKIKKQKKSQSQSQPSTAILSMAPHLRRSAASTTLNARAARLALDQRKKREERAHVTDVIGGWGPPGSLPDEESEQIRLNHLDEEKREFLENDRKEWEKEGGTKGYEKKLRKVAQRGVVKLFNAIRAAQSTTTDDVQATTTEIPKSSSLPGGKKQNALGGKESALADLSKSNFLDLIRSGGGGSKAGAKKVAV